MHTQTNRWTEQRTGYRYAGCIGYDDPVYDTYRYPVDCSETIVVFDDGQERRQFFNMVLALKPACAAAKERDLAALRKEAGVRVANAQERLDLDWAEYHLARRMAADRGWLAYAWCCLTLSPPLVRDVPTVEEEYAALCNARPSNVDDLVLSYPDTYDMFTKAVLFEEYTALTALAASGDQQ